MTNALHFFRGDDILNTDYTFDTVNLKHDADFETYISTGLFWVPVNQLGYSRFMNFEIKEMKNYSPELIREKSLNCYEAIQLFQASKFLECNDILKIKYNNTIWQYHKPGYHAVISNKGCCASSSAWFNYIISNHYPVRGYLHYVRPDGSGHIMNFVFSNHNYYIFDLSTMTDSNVRYVPKENGNIREYINAKYFTGVCYKTAHLKFFVKYHSRIQKYKNYEFAYMKINGYDAVPPSCCEINNSKIFIISSVDKELLLIPSQYSFVKREPPDFVPNWNFFR